MSLTSGKHFGDPYYKREFKQEQFIYEETSNVDPNEMGNSCINQPFHYLIIGLIALLFLGSLCLLALDLLYGRRIEEHHRLTVRQRRRGATTDDGSPIPRVYVNEPQRQGPPYNDNVGRRHDNTPASPVRLRA